MKVKRKEVSKWHKSLRMVAKELNRLEQKEVDQNSWSWIIPILYDVIDALEALE